MDGEVIAINTFGDFSDNGGPGISGSISIYLATPVLEAATQQLAGSEPPPADRLPVMPREPFPLSALQAAATAEWWDEAAYDVGRLSRRGNFEVRAFTPPYVYRMEKQAELALAAARRQRESQAGVNAGSYSPFEDLKSWFQYVGEYAPVVALRILPKVGETTASVIGNLLGAAVSGYAGTPYYGAYTLEFKGDLHDVTFESHGVQVFEIERGMIFVPLSVNSADLFATYRGTDLARAGLFILDPNLFAPTDGAWPAINVTIHDLKNPGTPLTLPLPRRTVERVWADFAPYREQVAADTARLVVAGNH